MKKTIFFVLSLMAVTGLFAGCRGKNEPETTVAPTSVATAPTTMPTTAPTEPQHTQPSTEEETLMPSESTAESTGTENTDIVGRNRTVMPNIR